MPHNTLQGPDATRLSPQCGPQPSSKALNLCFGLPCCVWDSPDIMALWSLCLKQQESLVHGEHGFSRDTSLNYWLCNFSESVLLIEPWFSHLSKRLVTLPSWLCVVTK